MKKEYLQQLMNKNNIQIAMSLLLNKKYNKYSKVGFNNLRKEYTIYNFWLDIDTKLSIKEYNYIKSKFVKTN